MCIDPSAATAPVIEAEADDYEYDSGIGSESIASSTTSISSSILKYREENGRTYHAYKDGAYAFPNDETENDRLDFQHHEFLLTQNGKLYTAPITDIKLSNVLDVGTGTGIWAIDFADEHPEAKVIGVDLSPIQPSFLPPNVAFQIDDVEEPWTYTENFDFIHSRMMIGSLANVPKFVSQCFNNVTPGGYLEMSDVTYPVRLNGKDAVMPESSAIKKWSDLFEDACQRVGRNARCATLYKQQMIDAGFEDVVETKYVWPSNRWPKDKHLKELGIWQLENLSGGLEAISIGLFTRVLGWSKPELDVFLVDVLKEMKDTKFHTYWEVIVVHGKKPDETKAE